MANKQLKVFAPSKVDIDHQKIEAYLKGERIYPTTMEIDLTQLCTRTCSGCPYGVSRKAGLTLELPFLDRLLGILGPHTPGLVLSGGESTIVPHFAQTLAMARKKGFKEIALISNGGHTHKPHVQDALLEHVTSIRISLYDWQDGKSEYFIKTLDKIRALRNRIDKEGSRLEIGASMLTRSEWNGRYEAVALEALSAGADWIYFHPYCVDWDKTHPVQADQAGVLEAIENLQAAAPQNANIQVPLERYSEKPLHFKKLHGSHFLIHVGADGIIYAGPECKYEKDFALLNLHEYMKDDFLWHPQRLMRLGQFTSDNYRYIGTKHRPPMFSDHIQKIIDLRKNHRPVESLHEPSSHFSYPCII